MAEYRSAQVMINIEPTIAQALELASIQANDTKSSYIRNLLIKDLREQGLLTVEMLAEMATR